MKEDSDQIPESKDECEEGEDGDSLIRGNVFKNPEILKMHLDILYKTVSFLDKNKINEGLPQYLENKKARLQEQEKNNLENKVPKQKRGPKARNPDEPAKDSTKFMTPNKS